LADIDAYASSLLEVAKRFLEKGLVASDEESGKPYLTASLLIGVAALEAHLNAIAEEMSERAGLGVLERSILQERDYRLDKGEFQLGKALKMYRLEDRLEFIFKNFSKATSLRTAPWWSALQGALDLRNKIVHPKGSPNLTKVAVEKALQAIIDCLNALYFALFKKGLPGYKRGLDSILTF
jgi:hypothetical protein